VHADKPVPVPRLECASICSAPSPWRLRKAKTLVKLLVLAPGHRLHREQVIAVLWPDRPPAAAANNLHQVLHVARRQLDGGEAGRRRLRLEDDVLSLSRTLEAALDWSHDLLDEQETALLRRLAVFAGTFDLGAVEGVCGNEEAVDVLSPEKMTDQYHWYRRLGFRETTKLNFADMDYVVAMELAL
jgi:hypothetical protein